MPDKLTDSEIVNIAEYCSNFDDCKFCKIILPNNVKKGTNGCFSCLLKLMLSVISVKENEKEKMRYRLADTITRCAAHEQKIKAEAYKEFAEKLENRILSMLTTVTLEKKEIICACIGTSNNVLKELVGENM